LRIGSNGLDCFASVVLMPASGAEYVGMLRLHVVASGRTRKQLGERLAETFQGNVGDADRLGSKVYQGQSGIQCRLDVVPEINHWIELKDPATLNCMKIILVEKIKNNILAQSWAYQARQADDQMAMELLFDDLFKLAAM